MSRNYKGRVREAIPGTSFFVLRLVKMAHIRSWRFSKHLLEHAAEIKRIAVAEPLTNLGYVQVAVAHPFDRLAHSQPHMGFDDGLARLFFECGR